VSDVENPATVINIDVNTKFNTDPAQFFPPTLPYDTKCVICRENEGMMSRRCECAAYTHDACWNLMIQQAGVDEKGEPIPPGDLDPQVKCPNCRQFLDKIPDSRTRRLFRFVKDKKIHLVELASDEDIVANPWTLFLTKTPCQKIVTAYGTLWRMDVKLPNGDWLPCIHRNMKQDEEVLEVYGPLYKVRLGRPNAAEWPDTWRDAAMVHNKGVTAIRGLFGSSDFNHQWVVEQMVSLITREVPLWKDAVDDCVRWVRSDYALQEHGRMVDEMVRQKDAAELQKWKKVQLNGPLSSGMIKFLGNLFPYMWLIRLLFVCYSVGAPFAVINIYHNKGAAKWWVLALIYFTIWYLWYGLCGWLSWDKMPRLKVMNALYLWKTCSFHIPLPPIQAGAIVKMAAKHDKPCEVVKDIEVYGCVVDGMPVVIPNGCAHDMHAAIRIRFVFERPPTVLAVENRFFQYAIDFLNKQKWDVFHWYSDVEWLNHLAPSRRLRLLDEDTGGGDQPKHWTADIFVKAEAYVGKTWEAFKPRMIQARKAPLQLLVGPYFYAIYKWFARTFRYGKHVYSVNLNARELGVRAFASFGKGTVFEWDASNWDGSVTNTMLRIEKYLLENIVPYVPPYLGNLLKYWTDTKGKSKGVSYKCNWGRRSGDLWTSTFNTLLNILVTDFVWADLLVEGTYNGDDNWVVVEKQANYEENIVTYQELGLKMVGVRRECWRDLIFCSGKFYMTKDHGPKWGLLPFRQLSKFGINFGRHSRRKFKGLLYGNAMSMLPIAGHIPIFGTFLRRIVLTAEARGVEMIKQERHEWQITDSIVDTWDLEEEAVFKKRYGLSDMEYARLELWAESIHIDNFPMVLEDDIFRKCAMVDVEKEEIPRNDHREHSKFWHGEESPMELFVIVEELLFWLLPYSWLVWGSMETVLFGSVFAIPGHFLLHWVRTNYGIVVSTISHLALNRFITWQDQKVVSVRSRRKRSWSFSVAFPFSTRTNKLTQSSRRKKRSKRGAVARIPSSKLFVGKNLGDCDDRK